MPDLSGRTLGGYRLIAVVRQGGMATVYRALRVADGHPVAVKVLGSTGAESEQFLQRFRREARVLRQMSHPYIVPVEAFDEIEGQAFLAMPLYEAGSLADLLRRGPIHPADGGRVIDQISAALQYAHEQEVVHRDVKPSNILVASDGSVLLTDFGLAQIADASLSLTGSALLGTPSYASPEQVRGDEVTGQSDQYSLGIVLFEMTTGVLPFEADTPLAVLMKHVNEPTPAPSSFNRNIPEVIERVILRATAKRPEDRFPSVRSMNAAFQAALAHVLDPLEHPPPTIPLPAMERRSKILRREARNRRRRGLLAGGALLLGLLICGSAAFLTGLLGAPKPLGESAQLTALAGTIQALSTLVVAEQGPGLAPEALEMALLETLAAGAETPEPTTLALALALGEATATNPIPSLLGSPPATGPFPTMTLSSTIPPATGTAPAGATTSASSTIPVGASVTPGLPIASSTLFPTSTPVASATASQPPTFTPTSAPPTPTLAPATPTPPPSPCTLTNYVGSSRSGQEFTVLLRNNGPGPYTITRMTLAWPGGNEDLKKIELAGDEIWSGEASSPITITAWKSGSDRRIQPGANRPLVLFFEDTAASSGYSLSVTLDAVCTFSFLP